MSSFLAQNGQVFSFSRRLTAIAECALCCHSPKNNHKRYNLPFSVSFYFPLPPLLRTHYVCNPHVYFIPKRLAFFFLLLSLPFSTFRVSKWTVSTINVACLLSIFYLFFGAQSPVEVSASRLQKKPYHATTGMNKMLTAVTSGHFLSKLNTQLS